MFGLSDRYWLRAQEAYDLECARREIVDDLDRIVPWDKVVRGKWQDQND